jgi:hypothetical protein
MKIALRVMRCCCPCAIICCTASPQMLQTHKLHARVCGHGSLATLLRASQVHAVRCQVSLSATQQLCAAGALVTLLHREGALSAPQEDAGIGSRHLLAVNSIAEVLHATADPAAWRCYSVLTSMPGHTCGKAFMVYWCCPAGFTGWLPDGGRCVTGGAAGTATTVLQRCIFRTLNATVPSAPWNAPCTGTAKALSSDTAA